MPWVLESLYAYHVHFTHPSSTLWLPHKDILQHFRFHAQSTFDLSVYTDTRYPLVPKEFFSSLQKQPPPHNSESISTKIQPLDYNDDTTKQQELGNDVLSLEVHAMTLESF
ncbi:hypothetical protein AV530_006300 [Patagioenas fasciata monilis]|uniref:Uncharacterized protein n=1 Tax=Patagioenas fasciata monilis TaxID=372326 RepID=A0A1V4KG04_PATFA|nr:hypothetical protein AV530_006300 [Patagioenas fasciata monilis]